MYFLAGLKIYDGVNVSDISISEMSENHDFLFDTIFKSIGVFRIFEMLGRPHLQRTWKMLRNSYS
jgi:hypothetical protein